MTRRVLAAAYRPWAQRLLYSAVPRSNFTFTYSMAISRMALEDLWSRAAVQGERYDAIVLIGWSWIVPGHIYNDTPTICVHPSPLPRYRGGSPLQHQIIAGEDESALTFFRVQDGPVDAGPIYAQRPFSLDGSLEEIFSRIEALGGNMLPGVLDGVFDGRLVPTPQDEAQATYYPRRRPEQSEIDLADISYQLTARQLRDKVRALAHPDYPRAFIRVGGENVELWDVR